MSITLETRITQKLSPTAIQLVNLIQMTGFEMMRYINDLSYENPVFEVEYYEDNGSYFASQRNAVNAQDENEDQFVESLVERESIYQDVCVQLSALRLTSEQQKNTRLMAKYLDKRAWIPTEDFMLISRILGSEAAEEALQILQTLSPAGIAARDLSECLCLQLKRDFTQTELAEEIVNHHLELVAKGYYSQISKLTGAPLHKVKDACECIKGLNPRPGAVFSTSENIDYVEPDLILKENGQLYLNRKFEPRLTLSPYYREIARNNSDPEVSGYLREKFRQVDMLINNISQRNETLLTCAEAIIRRQQLFFNSNGQCSMQPLTQSQIATDTGLSESTISRAVRNKYLQTDFGMFPLSAFFSVGLLGEQGASTADVKQRIQLLVEQEDVTEPLSDQKIADLLAKENIDVARSTVAKYRKQLNIPGTFARKKEKE